MVKRDHRKSGDLPMPGSAKVSGNAFAGTTPGQVAAAHYSAPDLAKLTDAELKQRADAAFSLARNTADDAIARVASRLYSTCWLEGFRRRLLWAVSDSPEPTSASAIPWQSDLEAEFSRQQKSQQQPDPGSEPGAFDNVGRRDR